VRSFATDNSPDDLRDKARSWGIPDSAFRVDVWQDAIVPQRKGGPGPVEVHPEPAHKTLRRYQHNARLRRLAQARYPGLSGDDAVERWWRHGGTSQPLRVSGRGAWSDRQVAELEAAMRTDAELERRHELERLRQDARPGDAALWTGPSKPKRSKRTPPRDAVRAARDRERYARRQYAKGKSYRPRPR
jgi:hypothetical protein